MWQCMDRGRTAVRMLLVSLGGLLLVSFFSSLHVFSFFFSFFFVLLLNDPIPLPSLFLFSFFFTPFFSDRPPSVFH